jgi:SEC-C motif-containing protein
MADNTERNETDTAGHIPREREVSLCPCKSRQSYAMCCLPFHQVKAKPETAEQLMRSRYSAFVKELAEYLRLTWHPSTRPLDPPRFEPSLRWLGREVKRHQCIDDNHAVVEFVARSKLGGRAHRLHETSRFVREGGRWFYVGGDID